MIFLLAVERFEKESPLRQVGGDRCVLRGKGYTTKDQKDVVACVKPTQQATALFHN